MRFSCQSRVDFFFFTRSLSEFPGIPLPQVMGHFRTNGARPRGAVKPVHLGGNMLISSHPSLFLLEDKWSVENGVLFFPRLPPSVIRASIHPFLRSPPSNSHQSQREATRCPFAYFTQDFILLGLEVYPPFPYQRLKHWSTIWFALHVCFSQSSPGLSGSTPGNTTP